MPAYKNLLLPGPDGRMLLTDVFFDTSNRPKPVLIYAHGFNGFKDWGGFDLLAKQFALAGFVLIKFNFSGSGTTSEEPESFSDLEAYSENNYSKELEDLTAIIDWASGDNPFHSEMDQQNLGLIGHSLGGGIAIIQAAEDPRIKALATWASISLMKTPWGNWSTEQMAEWKRTGIAYTTNSRTKQELPLRYQLHEDYLQHRERLDIPAAMSRLKIPLLICHGTEDSSVPVAAAHTLHDAHPGATLFTLASDHVFGRKHPWTEAAPPPAMQQVMSQTLAFFQEHLNPKRPGSDAASFLDDALDMISQ